MDLRVKELCKERGMLMENLAQILGVTRITLTRNINGNPTMETLQKIASALNVQVWELFTASTTGEINGFVEYRGTIYKIQERGFAAAQRPCKQVNTPRGILPGLFLSKIYHDNGTFKRSYRLFI